MACCNVGVTLLMLCPRDVCVYVCIYICIYIRTYVCNVCIYMYIYVCVCMCVCMYALCMYACIHLCIYVCVYYICGAIGQCGPGSPIFRVRNLACRRLLGPLDRRSTHCVTLTYTAQHMGKWKRARRVFESTIHGILAVEDSIAVNGRLLLNS